MTIVDLLKKGRENTVFILFGSGRAGAYVAGIYEKMRLPVLGICDNQSKKWGNTLCTFPVISPTHLQTALETHKENLWVQLSVGEALEPEIRAQLQDMGITQILDATPGAPFLSQFIFPFFQEEYPQHGQICQKIAHYHQSRFRGDDQSIQPSDPAIYSHFFVCQPGKTGDYSITQTYLKATGTSITHTHKPDEFSKEGAHTQPVVKVITGIRDPIARELSGLFDAISYGGILAKPLVTFPDFDHFLSTKSLQNFFAQHLTLFEHKCTQAGRPIFYYETFFTAFAQHILDLRKTPFDQEKGYVILKEGNIEVFFYQLEKLNQLVPDLSQFMGLPFDTLEQGNATEDKWIAPYYETAKKEVKFSQKYFDACYNDPYVTHCYSTTDIEKFKAKWQKNIES